jgi:nucleoside-diphosphate-sugar epimerase
MNLLQERFLVTGATGFVGACLVRKLASLGCEVHALARPGADRWRLEGLAGKLHWHVSDLTDGERLAEIVSAVAPTAIYHFATHGAYPHQTDADQIILTGVFGTWNLLKACAAVDYKLFVNIGSSSEYGNKEFAMRETDALAPRSYYAVAKCAQTLVSEQMALMERRPISTLRLFSVYGPYEEPTRLAPTVIERCLQTGQLSLQCGEVFNIGTGTQSTVRDIVNAALDATDAQVKINWGRMAARPWDTNTWLADTSKARRMLKWSATTSLAEGIAKTVEWRRSRGYWKPESHASHAVRAV